MKWNVDETLEISKWISLFHWRAGDRFEFIAKRKERKKNAPDITKELKIIQIVDGGEKCMHKYQHQHESWASNDSAAVVFVCDILGLKARKKKF